MDVQSIDGIEIGLQSTWSTQDSCSYHIYGNSPYFFIPPTYSGNVGTSEMLVHYLEWSDFLVDKSSTYTNRPLETSSVSVMDD